MKTETATVASVASAGPPPEPIRAMKAWRWGLVVARRRLVRLRALAGLTLTMVLLLGLARLEQTGPDLTRRGQILREAWIGVFVPLWAYFLVRQAGAGTRIDAAVEPLARAGIDRRGAMLGLLVGLLAVAAGSGVALAALVCLASGPASWSAGPGELAALLWMGGLGTAAYAAALAWGATFGRAGRGGLVVLLLDWWLGTSRHAWALPWPRAQLRALLTGAAPVDMLPDWSSVLLIVVMLVAVGGATVRVSR